MRISDWSSDVCSSDLVGAVAETAAAQLAQAVVEVPLPQPGETLALAVAPGQTVELQFAYDAAAGQMVDGDLVLAITGGAVVLQGFAEAATAQPQVERTTADGPVIDQSDKQRGGHEGVRTVRYR